MLASVGDKLCCGGLMDCQIMCHGSKELSWIQMTRKASPNSVLQYHVLQHTFSVLPKCFISMYAHLYSITRICWPKTSNAVYSKWFWGPCHMLLAQQVSKIILAQELAAAGHEYTNLLLHECKNRCKMRQQCSTQTNAQYNERRPWLRLAHTRKHSTYGSTSAHLFKSRELL